MTTSTWPTAAGGSDHWREVARKAGVHLYSEAGDQVYTEKQLLTVHAARDGVRRIALPSRCRVRDAWSDEIVLDAGTEFTTHLKRGATAVWRIEEQTRG